MSKVVPISPEATPQDKPVIALTAAELAEIVEAAVDRALEKRKPAKLLFDTKEAAAMLNVPDSWLAAKARRGEVPHRQTGHYRSFSMQDIDAIIAQFAIVPRPIAVIYSSHDGKEVPADSTQARSQPVAAGEAFGCLAEHGGDLGPRRKADSGNGRALPETPSRKKTEGGN